jgi:hypothetical protein
MRVLGRPHMKWKEKLSSFGAVNLVRKNKESRKKFLHLISR